MADAVAEAKEEMRRRLADAIRDMEVETAADIARVITTAGWFEMELLETAVAAGMSEASRLYEEGEYFIPELLSCADAAEEATKIFRPYMMGRRPEPKGCVVIGSVAGDTHDIGKNIVALVVEAAGYDVFDIGRDVSAERFVDAVIEEQADALALASLMTTSMNHMADVIQLMKQRGCRQSCRVIVGGKPISPSFAQKIGADYYSSSAGDTVRILDEIMKTHGN